MAVGEKGKQLAEFVPCTLAACDHSQQLAATSCREHVPKVAELWDSFSFSFPTSASETSLSSVARAVPRYRAHLNSFNATAFLMHPALAATTEDYISATNTCLQTPQGYFPDFFSTSRLMPDSIIISVFPMFTRRPFFSISVFHVCTFTSNYSMESALIMRYSVYSSSHEQAVLNSLGRASNTMMKSSGLRTEP